MLKYVIVFGVLCSLVTAESPVQGIKSTNVIGSADQHTSFSFIRPGLTQTSYAFNGPSSHQSFASSIGNPQLAQRVLPSLAHALAYKHPGLGYYPLVANGYGVVPTFATPATTPLAYQSVIDPIALAYMQQLQQQQHAYPHAFPQPNNIYQSQLAQLIAFRQAQLAQDQQLSQLQSVQSEQVSERAQQEEQRPQNLLGVAYSSAPSVAHVKVSGNGYKFNF